MVNAVQELDDFETYLVDVARQLDAMGAKQQTFHTIIDGNWDDAVEYQGWSFFRQDQDGHERVDPGGPIYYLEADWGHFTDFLGTNGLLYREEFWAHDLTDPATGVMTHTEGQKVEKLSSGGQVGNGKPFAQARKKFDSMLIKTMAASRDRKPT